MGNNIKTVETTVTESQLAAATGGVADGGTSPVWVECPADYDAAKITAADIVNDDRICVVDEPSDDDGELDGATEEQIEALRLMAVNDITREIMATGVLLTHDESDDLGDEVLAWMTSRLGLKVTETDEGMECVAS